MISLDMDKKWKCELLRSCYKGTGGNKDNGMHLACNTSDSGDSSCAKHYASHWHKPVFLVHYSQMPVKTRHDVAR